MMSARRAGMEAMSDGLLEDLVQVLLFHENITQTGAGDADAGAGIKRRKP